MKRSPARIDCIQCQHRAASVFCNLKSEELTSLNDFKQTFFVKRKQALFFENDTVKGLYCVHEGKVKLFKTLNDGNVQILRIAKSADLIGYRGLLGDGRYIASAEAMEDCTICFIPKEKIFQFIANNVNFALGLMSRIAADISEAETKAINFLQKSSKERLAETLLLLEHSFGTTPDGFININLTREEIASITGMAIETTIRILHQWEHEGIIELHKKHIRLANHPKVIELSAVEE